MYKLYNISKNKFITKNNLNNIIYLKFFVIDFDNVIIFNNKDVFILIRNMQNLYVIN